MSQRGAIVDSGISEGTLLIRFEKTVETVCRLKGFATARVEAAF